MVVIKRLREVRPTKLANDAEGARILDNPIGRASLKDGPLNDTCSTCLHWAVSNSIWTNFGTGAVCLEHKRLRNGRVAQVIPGCWPACDRHQRRPGEFASVLNAANFDARIMDTRQKIDRLRFALDKAREELAEIERQRREVSALVNSAKLAGPIGGGGDPRCGSAEEIGRK